MLRPTPGDYVVLTFFCFFMVAPMPGFLIAGVGSFLIRDAPESVAAALPIGAAMISIGVAVLLFRELTRVRDIDS